MTLARLRELGLRVVLARWGVAFAALTAALAITIRSHGYFIHPYAVPVMSEEGAIGAMALRMVHGHFLPYVDGVSHRGPIPYWLGALVMDAGRAFSWAALRWLALFVALWSEVLLFLLGLELVSPFAAGIAVLVQTYFLTFEVHSADALGGNGGLAYDGEIVGVMFALSSALLVARLQSRSAGRGVSSRAPSLVAAGALAACAGLSKQGMLVHVAPALFWLVVGPSAAADGGASARGRGARWVDVAVYLLGLAAPFAAVLAVYGGAGHLRELVYYYARYGRQIGLAPLTWGEVGGKLREQIDDYLLGITSVAFTTLVAVARVSRALLSPPRKPGEWGARVRAHAGSLFLLLHLVAAVIGASFSWRFFPHYFVEVYPFLGLVAGYAMGRSFDGMDELHLPDVAGGLVVVAGAVLLLGITTHTLHENVVIGRQSGQSYQEPQADPIVRYVAETTKPSDTLFVWGRHAEIYVSAERYPASRFVDTIYPAGVVPWFPAPTAEEQERRVVPGSRELLLGDLEEGKPELIVDAGRSMDGRYMYSIPILREYLDKEYCFVRHIDGEPVYRRRHEADCPPPDALQ